MSRSHPFADRGARPGATRRLVAIRVEKGPPYTAALRRVWQAGNAALPLDPDASQAQVDEALAALRPSSVLETAGERPRSDGVGVADGTALVVATSGTTGPPKGVVLSHAAVQASARATLRRLGLGPRDRWLCCLPLHHIAGVMVLARAWRVGAEPVVHGRFDVEAVAATADGHVVSLVPTMLVRLLDAGVDLDRFRCILLGGAPAPAGLLERARAAGARVVTTYGMSETCGGCVYDGLPLDDVCVDVDAGGRVKLRGPVLFDGYRAGTALAGGPDAQGWFTTADLGRFDGDRLVIVGRADGVLLSGGENVVPERVEAALVAHPAVAEVAVIGRPDEQWGEAVVAVVVPAGAAPTLAALRALAVDRLGRAHAPRDLVVVDSLPRLASGKPDRVALRAAYG